MPPKGSKRTKKTAKAKAKVAEPVAADEAEEPTLPTDAPQEEAPPTQQNLPPVEKVDIPEVPEGNNEDVNMSNPEQPEDAAVGVEGEGAGREVESTKEKSSMTMEERKAKLDALRKKMVSDQRDI